MKKIAALLVLMSAATWSSPAALVLEGLPGITAGSDYGFNGTWDMGDGTKGLWYDDGAMEGWYLRPSADGQGWEAGLLSVNINGERVPVRMTWTPQGGWNLDPAEGYPEIENLAMGSEYFGSATNQPFRILDNSTDPPTILFDSDAFVPGTLPSSEDLSWWDNVLQNYYAQDPSLNQYTPHNVSQFLSPNPGGGSEGGDLGSEVSRLNTGLDYNDGIWVLSQP